MDAPGGYRTEGILRDLAGFGAAEEFVDVAAVFLGAIEDEQQFGGAAKLEAFGEFVANEAGGCSKSFDGVFLFVLSAHNADVDPGLFKVGGDAYFGNGSEGGDTRVFQFSGQHGADFLLDFGSNAFVAMAGNGHMNSLFQNNSRGCSVTQSQR